MLRSSRFVLLLLILTACNPLRPAQLEPPQLPEQYSQQPAADALPLPERWWLAFNDPQLNRLQEQLLTSNLDLRQALYRLEQLDALRRSSGAGLWPSLNLKGNASRDHSPTLSGSSDTESYSASLAASYEIDLWNRLHDRQQAAELRLQAGAKESESLLLSLTAQLAESYFASLEQRAQLELLQQQLKNTELLLTTAQNRYRAGLSSSDELYQLEGELAALQARLPLQRTALSRSEQAIALLLGSFERSPLAADSQLPQPGAPLNSGLPASLLQQRPDIAAALLQLQADDHELAAALADRLPGISLSASLGRSSSQLASGDIEGSFWSLAAGLLQPLFDGGRRQAAVDQQQALRSQQAAALQQLLVKAVQEVETALIAEQNSSLRYRQLQQQVASNRKNLQLARANYRSGLTVSSSLLRSELQLLASRSQLLSSQHDWLTSRISLARALGGGWMAAELEKQQQQLTTAEEPTE